MDPTLGGFQWFVANIMGIPTTILPITSPVFAFVFNLAMNTVNTALNCMPNANVAEPTLYATAVYNFAANALITFSPDNPALQPPNNTFFASLRQKYGMNTFVGGVISSTSDQGTSQSMDMPDFIKGLTVGDLNLLKTPWGQAYLAIAQDYGTLWGIT